MQLFSSVFMCHDSHRLDIQTEITRYLRANDGLSSIVGVQSHMLHSARRRCGGSLSEAKTKEIVSHATDAADRFQLLWTTDCNRCSEVKLCCESAKQSENLPVLVSNRTTTSVKCS